MHVMVAVLCSWAGCFDVTALLSTEENKGLWVTCQEKLQKKKMQKMLGLPVIHLSIPSGAGVTIIVVTIETKVVTLTVNDCAN